MNTILARIQRRIARFLQRRLVLERDETLVVGVSGGADSVCLLHALANLSSVQGFRLHIAHLNHGLRGREADEDAAFVASLVQELGLTASIERRSIQPVRKERRLGIEEAARQVRYEFLAEVAEGLAAKALAVGHTADDQVETILMHWLRGAGLRGLRGMLPLTELSVGRQSLVLARPLLNTWRSETEAYCQAAGLQPRLDASNRSLQFTRNRIRHRLLPELLSYNPALKRQLLTASRSFQADWDFLRYQADQAWKALARVELERVALPLKETRELHPALQARLLVRAAELFLPPGQEIAASHVEAMLAALEKAVGTRIDLPSGVQLRLEYDDLVIEPRNESGSPASRGIPEVSLKIPGETSVAGWTITAELLEGLPSHLATDDPWVAYFDAEALPGKLWVRSRRPGDSLVPFGMSGSKKLQNLFVDAKVPRSERDLVPLLFTGDELLWVVGLRRSSRVVPHSETQCVLRITFEEKETHHAFQNKVHQPQKGNRSTDPGMPGFDLAGKQREDALQRRD